MTKPAGVPDDYMATPNGYLHPSCVLEIRDDQAVVPDGPGIAIVDVPAASAAGREIARVASSHAAVSTGRAGNAVGAIDLLPADVVARSRHLAPCAHDRFDRDGHRVDASNFGADNSAQTTATPPPGPVSGWVENGNTSSLGNMSYLHAEWNIPAAPASVASQTVYFFPGFEHAGGSTTIMQPVLGWRMGGGSPYSGWSAMSWNCCESGYTTHSTAIPVSGTVMTGDVSGNGCSTTTGVCSTWAITSYIPGNGRSVTLNTSAYGRTMNWVFGGVLEAYGVTTCSHMPGGTNVRFSNFYMEDVANRIKTPTWSIVKPIYATGSGEQFNLSPWCNWNATVGSGNSVALYYH